MKADNITIEEKKNLLNEKAQLKGELSLVKDIVSFGGYSVLLVQSDRNGEVQQAYQNSANDEFHRNLASLAAMSIQTSIESRLQVIESMLE